MFIWKRTRTQNARCRDGLQILVKPASRNALICVPPNQILRGLLLSVLRLLLPIIAREDFPAASIPPSMHEVDFWVTTVAQASFQACTLLIILPLLIGVVLDGAPLPTKLQSTSPVPFAAPWEQTPFFFALHSRTQLKLDSSTQNNTSRNSNFNCLHWAH